MEEEDEADKQPELPVVPDKCGPPSISLSMLIDFAVQQVFHEITVLSELLPKKLDAEKKTSLVNFAHLTRLLSIKLLGIIKWVKTSKRFEHCASICYVLEQQSQTFVETADRLVMLAREELVFARLPTFQVCSAVDVLTQGTYCRLPLCIKQRFTREPKITPKEQANILSRINQVLQYRISRVASKLSPRIKDIRIRNGTVSLVVPGEFKVTLTVLGEAETIKWTLLNIKILVEDYEIGYGTQLVHPLQLNMIHNILQSRMDTSKKPLGEVYTFLHSFAQSLQLDVLFCQSTQLVTTRLRNKMVIERYDQKERVLSIGYWLQKVATRRGQPARYVPQYRVQIYCDREDPHNSLRVRHFPAGHGLGQLDDRSGRLSVDRLLSETMSVRCRERLLRIRKRLEAANSSAAVIMSGEAAPLLTYPLVDGTNVEELLKIAVNMFTGKVLCTVGALASCPELKNLEKSLYDGHSVDTLRRQINRLKVMLMIERYKRCVACLQVRIVTEAQMRLKLSKASALSADRIILQFIKEENFYLLVTFEADVSLNVKIEFFLLSCSDEVNLLHHISKEQPSLVAPMERFLKSTGIRVEPDGDDDWDFYGSTIAAFPPRNSWERQLTCAVSAVDDRISFMRLTDELNRRGIRYSPVETESVVGGLMLRITDVQSSLDVKVPEFFQNLVRCCLRLDTRSRVLWPFECCLKNNPLPPDCLPGRPGPPMRTWIQEVGGTLGISQSASDTVSTAILERLSIYSHIYKLVNEFAKVYRTHYHKFCSIQAYTYHKLVIAYGEKRDQLLVLSYRPKNTEKRLVINFGQTVPVEVYSRAEVNWPNEGRWNPHALMSNILMEKFNAEPDLVDLVHYVTSTSAPLCALASFARIRFHSVKALAQIVGAEMLFPLQMRFHLFPTDEYTVRLVYGHLHLEFGLLENSQVGIRDCSRYHPSAVGLQQFLNWISEGTATTFNEATAARNASPAAPNSLPPQAVSAHSPSISQSLSVPPPEVMTSPQPTGSQLTLTSDLILIDHLTLQKACKVVDAAPDHSSPLDTYLSSVVYLYRVGAALDHMHNKQSNASHGCRFDSLVVQPDSIRISITSVTPANPAKPHSPCQVNFNIHLDPVSFTVKITIEYNGESAPLDSDLRVLENYFERCVVRLQNEFAVIAFLSLCRLTPNGALANVSQVMSAQMDSSPSTYWTVSVQLATLVRDTSVPQQAGGAVVRKFRPGVMIEGTQGAVRMLLCFRPQRPNPKERSMEKHLLVLIYNMQTNQVSLGPSTKAPAGGALSEDEQSVVTVLNAQNDASRQNGECPLWPAVMRLVDKYSSANIGAMPASVTMPGSVVPPGSVGPVGSVGPIGSVSGVGSVNNPLMNPGSNLP